MSYTIEYHPKAELVRRTLPRTALNALDTLEHRLQRDPWSAGKRMAGGLKDTLEAPFGRFGFATCVVQDTRVLVSVISLTWTG
ncbi:type II toxin-antitoxin system RelE/ParE family toxin [Embleya sp. NPDC056575]|uniref:type II toxin-antitoxin system RelE family toxin n=1 Tax=unclassified Embleya TaxID=2699296 RepID=UPI00368A92E8